MGREGCGAACYRIAHWQKKARNVALQQICSHPQALHEGRQNPDFNGAA
jgi:hypothetical protein